MKEEYICFRLLCRCGWKRDVKTEDDVKDLYEYQQADLQKSILNNKKLKRKRKFRCLKCGYAVPIYSLIDQQKKIDVKMEIDLKKKEIDDLEKMIKNCDNKKDDL